MSSFDLLPGSLPPPGTVQISLTVVAVYIAYVLLSAIYNVYFSPMAKFPGPVAWSVSNLPRILSMIRGDEGILYPQMHEKYGPIVRIGPSDLSVISEEGRQAWKEIYGFKKPAPFKDPLFYTGPLNGVPSIITADDSNHSRQRKILSHAFSDAA